MSASKVSQCPPSRANLAMEFPLLCSSCSGRKKVLGVRAAAIFSERKSCCAPTTAQLYGIVRKTKKVPSLKDRRAMGLQRLALVLHTRGGGGLAQGLGIRLFAFGGAYWPLATAHSDPLWVRTCFGCVNGAPG